MPKATSSSASSTKPAKPGRRATPTTKASAKSIAQDSPTKGKRQRIDWEAVERDYRTGKFTLRELEAKHGTNNATISRKIKSDRAADETRWQRDLTKAVRDATNAKLMQQMVSSEVSKGQQEVSNAVLAAAEINTNVILGHRSDLTRARSVALNLLEELANSVMLAEDQELLTEVLAGSDGPDAKSRARQVVRKALEVGNRIVAVKSLAEALTKLHTGERQAHNITGNETPDDERRSLPLEFVEPAHAQG